MPNFSSPTQVSARISPRVCLLQDSPSLGGVHTIVNELERGLRQSGWSVQNQPLRGQAISPLLHSTRAAQVLLATHNFLPAYTAWMLDALRHTPWVVWVHGPIQEVLAAAHCSGTKRHALRWLYRRVPHFVFISQYARTSMEAFIGQPLGPQRAHIIANAVTLPASLSAYASPVYSKDTDSTAPSATVELGYVGRLSSEKQPQRLLEMLRLLPAHYRLTLVGDGPLRAQLQQHGADLQRSHRLHFAGALPREQAFCADWQLTVLASRYEGGCPLSALESAAHGIAFVAPPLPALRESATGAAACLLAADDSPQSLARAVQNVLALSATQRRNALHSVLARHRSERFHAQWSQLLYSLVQQ